MDRCDVAIVIPAYNEAATIARVVEHVRTYGTPIVVSDGSSDRTAAIARASGATVVELSRNVGYDGALDAGFAAARRLDAQYILTIDADGQHPGELIPAFLERLRTTADVVVGIRDVRQRFGENVFAWVGKQRFGIDDPLCGMKGYRREVYDALGYFDRRKSIGTELALFAVRRGFSVEQVPVPTKPRSDAPRFGRRLSANWRILRATARAIVYKAPPSPFPSRARRHVARSNGHPALLISPDDGDEQSVKLTIERFLARHPDARAISFVEGLHVLSTEIPDFLNYRDVLTSSEQATAAAEGYRQLHHLCANDAMPGLEPILMYFHDIAGRLGKAKAIATFLDAHPERPICVLAPSDVLLMHDRVILGREGPICDAAAAIKRADRPAVLMAICELATRVAVQVVHMLRPTIRRLLWLWALVRSGTVRLARVSNRCSGLVRTRLFSSILVYRHLPRLLRGQRRFMVLVVVEDSGTMVNLDPAIEIIRSLKEKGAEPVVLTSSQIVWRHARAVAGAPVLLTDIGRSVRRERTAGRHARVSDAETNALQRRLGEVWSAGDDQIRRLGRFLNDLNRFQTIGSILTIYEPLPLCVAAGIWARSANLPWIGFQPILVGDRPDGHLFVADRHLVYGGQLADMMISDGVAPSDVVVVGSPTYDRFFGRDRASDRSFLENEFPRAASRNLVVVATEAFPDPLGELDPILRTLSADDTLHVVLKLHPQDSLEFFEPYVASLPHGDRISVVKSFALGPLLSGADLLICIISNIAISASVMGTPVLVCDFSNKRGPVDFVKEGLCFGCASPDQLEEAVGRMLGSSEVRASARAKVADNIARFNGPNDGRSADRIAEFMIAAKEPRPVSESRRTQYYPAPEST